MLIFLDVIKCHDIAMQNSFDRTNSQIGRGMSSLALQVLTYIPSLGLRFYMSR